MRLIVCSMIAGMYILLIAASASAGPIFQFNEYGASNPGFDYSCPMKNFVISLDDLDGGNFSSQFSLAVDRDAHVIEPKTVLAGMWVLQSGDVAALRDAGKQFEDLLIPLFAGSLLIGLSGLIKMLIRKQPIVRHEKAHVKATVSYEKTLWAESHGLM
jgi:hypothetical protein